MKVLVVEDQPAKSAEIAEFVREQFRYSIAHAGSFVEAQDALCQKEYDWVLLDMSLPFEGHSDVGAELEIEPLGGRGSVP